MIALSGLNKTPVTFFGSPNMFFFHFKRGYNGKGVSFPNQTQCFRKLKGLRLH